MSKKEGRSNFRVEVDPVVSRWIGFTPEQNERKSAELLAAEIRRHCDHGGVAVLSDDDSRCEHCNSRWTEKRTDYNGGCCDKDEGAEEARLAAVEAHEPG